MKGWDSLDGCAKEARKAGVSAGKTRWKLIPPVRSLPHAWEMMEGTGRGALFVFEGPDRSGKSSLISRLASDLKGLNLGVMAFPDRSTTTGVKIDRILNPGKAGSAESSNISPSDLHLLFCENRREKQAEMEEKLLSGTNLLVDRYAYSGIAYSAAQGFDLDHCFGSDRGLLAPDVIIHLDVAADIISKRAGYGSEVYENSHIQEMVNAAYKRMYDLLAASNEIVLVPYDRLEDTGLRKLNGRITRLFVVDAARDQEHVFEEARRIVSYFANVFRSRALPRLPPLFCGLGTESEHKSREAGARPA